ncbi:hypothetical protein [Sphingomonas yantingensis]|uniref:hypothetical protein n=1 Tax=Sphingomonas yantingensis TaxID=1241761 RepID=UPI003CCE0F88
MLTASSSGCLFFLIATARLSLVRHRRAAQRAAKNVAAVCLSFPINLAGTVAKAEVRSPASRTSVCAARWIRSIARSILTRRRSSSGADVQKASRGIGPDDPIGAQPLHRGPGDSGACFPTDRFAPIKTAQADRTMNAVSDTLMA